MTSKSLLLQVFGLSEMMLSTPCIYFYKYFIKHCKVWYMVSQRCYTHCMYTLRLHIIHRIHEHEYLYGGAQYVHPYIAISLAVAQIVATCFGTIFSREHHAYSSEELTRESIHV